jgi:hypothetical protein
MKNHAKFGRIFWKCTKGLKGCKSVIVTLGDFIIRKGPPHNHSPTS